MEIIEIRSAARIDEAAERLTPYLEKNRIIAFHGPMGAGKTTLIRALCEVLGVEDQVTSPTFALVNHYLSGTGEPIYHFDFYRIDDPREALDMGCEEYFDSGDLCLIEWPEKIAGLLPGDTLHVWIEPHPDKEEYRTVNIMPAGTAAL